MNTLTTSKFTPPQRLNTSRSTFFTVWHSETIQNLVTWISDFVLDWRPNPIFPMSAWCSSTTFPTMFVKLEIWEFTPFRSTMALTWPYFERLSWLIPKISLDDTRPSILLKTCTHHTFNKTPFHLRNHEYFSLIVYFAIFVTIAVRPFCVFWHRRVGLNLFEQPP